MAGITIEPLKYTEQLFGYLYWIIPILILFEVLRSAWFKGVCGELQVNWILRINLPSKSYHLLNNVTFPTGEGSTQVDHIVVSKYGIFVVETKNMKGWIFGSERGKFWTQKIFKHSQKFQNPLHQNYKHTKTLEAALGLPANCIFSVIVFIGDSTFKTDMPPNVTYARGCVKYVTSKKVEFFNSADVKQIVAMIESISLKKGLKTNVEHVSHVNAIVEPREQALKNNQCPECGAIMVLREAKRGPNIGKKFLGCSAFPKCRTTAKLIDS